MDWYLPKGQEFWIIFDKSNGDKFSKRYVWWFDTKEAALSQLRHWKKNDVTVTYSRPKKVRLVN